MSYIGIYPRNFLGKYYGRSINFQCFNCHLVSPKNYYIECHHCICERCVQKIQSCSSCVNQDIIIDGDNPTAFQFTLTEIMLNPYQMQCIFAPCEWQGTYQDFIKIHYRECKFKKNKRLMPEYLIEYNNHDYSHDKNKRSKSEIKIVKKNQKNKYLPVYNLNDSSDDDNIILDESSFDDKSNGLNLKNIEIEKGVNIDNNFNNNNKINTGITNRFSYPKIELKNDHHWLYDDDFDNGLNNIFTKRNSTNPEFKKTLNIKKEIDNYEYNLIPKDLLNDKKGKNKKNNFDEIVINLSDDNEEVEQSNEISIDVEEQEEEENEENENENEEDNEIESYEIVDEEEEEKEEKEDENEEASYYLRKNDNKKKIYEKREEKEEEEIEEEEDEEENDDNSRDEDYEDREVEEIEEDEYKESEEENSKRNRRREDNYRSKSYNYNFLRKKRNHDNYRKNFGLDNYNIYKNDRGIKNNHFNNHKRWKF